MNRFHERPKQFRFIFLQASCLNANVDDVWAEKCNTLNKKIVMSCFPTDTAVDSLSGFSRVLVGYLKKIENPFIICDIRVHF